jgi:hypothetical protein
MRTKGRVWVRAIWRGPSARARVRFGHTVRCAHLAAVDEMRAANRTTFVACEFPRLAFRLPRVGPLPQGLTAGSGVLRSARIWAPGNRGAATPLAGHPRYAVYRCGRFSVRTPLTDTTATAAVSMKLLFLLLPGIRG